MSSGHVDQRRLRLSGILWTSNFTIDRVKTLSAMTSEKIQVEGYTCPTWVAQLWHDQSQNTETQVSTYFGNHCFWVFLYWTCFLFTMVPNVMHFMWTISNLSSYRGQEHSFTKNLFYFKKYYKDNTPLENVLRFLVSILVFLGMSKRK